eukprot:5022181-Amphidinium_carterae.1
MAEVRAKYKLGKHEDLSVARSFNGRTIQQMENFEFTTSMEKYIKQVKAIELSTAKKRGTDSPASAEEVKQYRAVIGALMWCGRNGLAT